MADAKDDKKDILGPLFKVLFSCFLLSFVLNGYFTNGTAMLEDKLSTSLTTGLSAGKVLGKE